jgi:hypothetical protein
VSESKPLVKQTKPAVIAEEPKSLKEAEIIGVSGKVPYCYHCKTKAHAIEVCHVTMYCDICASYYHVRPRCPKFWAVKLAAMSCGYVMEGLGFFHIPYELSHKQHSESRTVLIRVLDGNLSIHNVVSELKRLILGSDMECGGHCR